MRGTAATICSIPVALSLLLAAGWAIAAERPSKDVGPVHTLCDQAGRGSSEWTSCVGGARAAMPDAELFYAGYWLAKSGRYAEALGYLDLARDKDERVLTYIGFARRKMGDVAGALPAYRAALVRNPDFVVARAYLGEAYLSQGDLAEAKAELGEIAGRCGTSCVAYAQLADEIAAYVAKSATRIE